MINSYPVVILFSFFIFLLNDIAIGQLGWKLSAETGYYNSSGTDLIKQNDLLAKLEGQIKFEHKENSSTALFQLKIRPEYYGFEKQLQSLKIKALGSYFRDWNELNGGVNLAVQKQKFKGTNFDLSYDIFILSVEANYFIWENRPFTLNFGYAYQSVSTDYDQNLDVIFLDGKMFEYLSQYFKLGYGAYLEKFSIEKTLRGQFVVTKRENFGWRYGPQINLNYLRKFVFNFDYRFLIHSSELTTYPSYEQWFRLAAGKMLSEEWSAFLLINYYIRKFKTSQANVESSLLYTPMNLENRIHIKIGYEINEGIELYLNSGYFKENLYKDDFSFEGWNALIGIEISK